MPGWAKARGGLRPRGRGRGLLAGRRGELPEHATVLVTTTALVAAGLGMAALQDESPAV